MNKRICFVFVTSGLLALGNVGLLRAAPTVASVAVTPATIHVSTPVVVIVTAMIPDSSLLPAGVNLLRVTETGSAPANIGNMFDDGTNGDQVAGDKMFTRAVSMNEPTTDDAFFRVSAAFRGVLKRTLSDIVTLDVRAPVNTSSWVTVRDRDELFDLRVPPDLRLQVAESPSTSGLVVKSLDFLLPTGDVLFTVDVFTRAGWIEQMRSELALPTMLGQTSDHVFAYWLSQSELGGTLDEELMPLVPDILGTFFVTR